MSNKSLSDLEHQIRYSTAIREARIKGMDVFQGWFDTSKSANQSLIRGYWDFVFHIIKPKVCEYIERPENKIALEIGYGGGRLLNAACSFFKQVIGIDIHDEKETVKNFLRSQNKYNFILIKTPGRSIDIDSESVDFIYSFIVLQHLPTFEVFSNYLKEAYRCLKSGGVAQLYFGRFSKLNPLDQLIFFLKGYKEIESPVNHTSLVIRLAKVEEMCRNLGFKIVDTGPSYKGVPDGYPHRRGGQNFITLLKPTKK